MDMWWHDFLEQRISWLKLYFRSLIQLYKILCMINMKIEQDKLARNCNARKMAS